MKTVEYLGQVLQVPEHIKWIAADGDGTIFGYSSRPVLAECETKWYGIGSLPLGAPALAHYLMEI